jgi:hypothetical protein
MSFVIWKVSRSRELTKPTLLDPDHFPGSHKHRYLLLNSLNNVLQQAIDRVDSHGNLIKGLWNSLSTVLGASIGAGSFDDANKDQCWTAFHASNSSFA